MAGGAAAAKEIKKDPGIVVTVTVPQQPALPAIAALPAKKPFKGGFGGLLSAGNATNGTVTPKRNFAQLIKAVQSSRYIFKR